MQGANVVRNQQHETVTDVERVMSHGNAQPSEQYVISAAKVTTLPRYATQLVATIAEQRQCIA